MIDEQNNDYEYESSGLTFKALFSFIKKALPCVLVCLLITMMIGVGVCALLSSTKGGKTVVQATFELTYDGAEEGLYPDGTILDIQKIKSAPRVVDAITKLGLNVSAAGVRDVISINGEYSAAVTSLIESFDGNEAKALEAARKSKFYYTRYVMTIDANAVEGLDGDNAALIINELLNSTRANEMDIKVSNLFAPSSMYTEEFATSGNMLEVIDATITEIDKISINIQNQKELNAENKVLVNSRATTTKNTLLALQRDIIISGAFLTESYTVEMAMSQVDMYISNYTDKIAALTKQIAAVNTALDTMKENAQIIINDKGDVINGAYFLDVYETMYNKFLALSDEQTYCETNKTNYDKQKISLQALKDSGLSMPSEEVVSSAKTRLIHAIANAKSLTETAEYLIKEVVGETQGLYITMAPVAVTISDSVSWLKCILISAIVGLLLGFGISPILEKFIKKRRKASKIMVASVDNASAVAVDNSDTVENNTDENTQA